MLSFQGLGHFLNNLGDRDIPPIGFAIDKIKRVTP